MTENIDNSQNVNPPAQEASAQEAPAPGKQRPRTMLIRYGKMGLIGEFRHSERHIPQDASFVIVHTDRGLEMGQIISPFFHSRGHCSITSEDIDHYCEASGANYPLSRQGSFVRFATEQDINENRHLEKNALQEAEYCKELIKKHNLPMKLVDIEHLFGGDRIIFYFMAEGRVDFRELVKELAHQYQTRIEMRQIGSRDEARLIADFETCGRQCCCKNFLKVLQPVNMRMAKVQKATLDPSKISGRCGRLKCCLRYEDQVYSELSKTLPRKNSCVLTESGYGTVIETQIITQLVKIRLRDARIVAVHVDDILQRNYQPPSEEQKPLAPPEKPVADVAVADTETAPETETETDTVAENASDSAPPPSTPQSQDESPSAPPAKKRRRRRRKKKKPSAPESDNSSAPSS